jgi:hypothetical protein
MNILNMSAAGFVQFVAMYILATFTLKAIGIKFADSAPGAALLALVG